MLLWLARVRWAYTVALVSSGLMGRSNGSYASVDGDIGGLPTRCCSQGLLLISAIGRVMPRAATSSRFA
eukprot:7404751-Lingulodinium_polyedra.AAC.1